MKAHADQLSSIIDPWGDQDLGMRRVRLDKMKALGGKKATATAVSSRSPFAHDCLAHSFKIAYDMGRWASDQGDILLQKLCQRAGLATVVALLRVSHSAVCE